MMDETKTRQTVFNDSNTGVGAKPKVKTQPSKSAYAPAQTGEMTRRLGTMRETLGTTIGANKRQTKPPRKTGLARLGSYQTDRLTREAGMSEDGGKSALMEARLRAAGKWNQQTRKIHGQANASSYVANNRWGARREAAAEAKRNFATSVLADTLGGERAAPRRGMRRNSGIAPAYKAASTTAPETEDTYLSDSEVRKRKQRKIDNSSYLED